MLADKRSHNKNESVPARRGIRPKTIPGPLHVQCDGARIPVYVLFRKMAAGRVAARLAAAMKFVVPVECFDLR
jgi:hypothetical protein